MPQTFSLTNLHHCQFWNIHFPPFHNYNGQTINIHTLNSIWKFTTSSYILSICHSTSLLILSYAFSKSIKPKYILCFFSHAFLPICIQVKIQSTHPLPDLKPPCSSSIKLSVTLWIMCMNIHTHFFKHAYIFLTFSPLSLILVQWNNHSMSSGISPVSKSILHSLQILSTNLSPLPLSSI